MKTILIVLNALIAINIHAQKPTFQQKSTSIEVFDFQEITMKVNPKGIANPFTDVSIKAEFTNGPEKISVNGFCDAQDGSLYKLRFMPQTSGDYQYNIDFTVNGKKYSYQNKFKAIASKRNGPLQVDAENPTHFIYRGSQQHFFWNGTTTYWLLGWKDEATIMQAIDRLAGYGINRLRVAINGRAHGGSRWNEMNVVESENLHSNSTRGWRKHPMI